MRQRPYSAFSRKARHFLTCIALCHTCLPETDEKGRTTFQASSPDELALVQAACEMGFVLFDRPAKAIVLETLNNDGTPSHVRYEVLDVIEFSSARKRMSIITRMPDGRIAIFCKGADNVIIERLSAGQDAAVKTTEDHLSEFASEGLRTLTLAYKVIPGTGHRLL